MVGRLSCVQANLIKSSPTEPSTRSQSVVYLLLAPPAKLSCWPAPKSSPAACHVPLALRAPMTVCDGRRRHGQPLVSPSNRSRQRLRLRTRGGGLDTDVAVCDADSRERPSAPAADIVRGVVPAWRRKPSPTIARSSIAPTAGYWCTSPRPTIGTPRSPLRRCVRQRRWTAKSR